MADYEYKRRTNAAILSELQAHKSAKITAYSFSGAIHSFTTSSDLTKKEKISIARYLRGRSNYVFLTL